MIVSTGFAVLTPIENIESRFLYYVVTNQQFSDYLALHAKGAAYPAVDTETISRAEFNFPPLPTQRKIASILSAYDDLIENNTRRIKILEEMAQTIYKEWFVNFRFPGHEKVKMGDSELGKIPEGWKIANLGEIIEIYKGKKAKNIFSLTENNRIAYLLIDGIKNHSFLYTDDRDRVLCEKNDVLMVMDGASSGQVYIGYEGFVGSTLAIFRVRSQIELSQYLLFDFLKCTFISISDNNVGSAIPHANKEFIKSMKILIATSAVNQKAHLNFSEIHDEINILKEKNGILRKFRDLLLPKLISGEIDVENLDMD